RQSRAGERMSADHLLGQAQLATDLTDLVLEQLAQWFDELERQSLRQATDIVMRLDGDRRTAGRRERLDHVGIQCPLHQISDIVADVTGLALEHLYEAMTDLPALGLGIGDSSQVG